MYEQVCLGDGMIPQPCKKGCGFTTNKSNGICAQCSSNRFNNTVGAGKRFPPKLPARPKKIVDKKTADKFVKFMEDKAKRA